MAAFSLGEGVFRHFGRARDFHPLVLLFQPFHSLKIFLSRQGFSMLYEHGYKELMEKLRRELIVIRGNSEFSSFAC